MFALPEHLESYATEVLRLLASEQHLRGLPRDQFAERLFDWLRVSASNRRMLGGFGGNSRRLSLEARSCPFTTWSRAVPVAWDARPPPVQDRSSPHVSCREPAQPSEIGPVSMRTQGSACGAMGVSLSVFLETLSPRRRAFGGTNQASSVAVSCGTVWP